MVSKTCKREVDAGNGVSNMLLRRVWSSLLIASNKLVSSSMLSFIPSSLDFDISLFWWVELICAKRKNV